MSFPVKSRRSKERDTWLIKWFFTSNMWVMNPLMNTILHQPLIVLVKLTLRYFSWSKILLVSISRWSVGSLWQIWRATCKYESMTTMLQKDSMRRFTTPWKLMHWTSAKFVEVINVHTVRSLQVDDSRPIPLFLWSHQPSFQFLSSPSSLEQCNQNRNAPNS